MKRKRGNGIDRVIVWFTRAVMVYLLVWGAWLYIKFEWIM